jgi:uncharacterized protein involved in exopolysaccharide biosynthesis
MPLEPQYDDEAIADIAPASPPAQPEVAREMSLLDVLITVAARKKPIAKFTAIWAVIAVVFCLLSSNRYTAKTSILPPQQAQSSSSVLMSQYGGLLAGLSGGNLGRSQNDVFIAMLQSETLQESLVRRLNLQSVYKAKTLGDARNAVNGHSRIESTKQGLIEVSVEETDPQLAADIANGYIDELQNLTGRLAIGEAGHRRLFFEQ